MSEPDKPGGGLIALAIERPVAVAVGVILVSLFGGLSILGIPIQLTPDIARPVLSVSTVWPGAAPAEVESEILEPQEDALKTLPDLLRMTSTARFAEGSIELELAVGTSLEEALVRASNLLSQVPSYPDNVDQPVLTTSGSTGPPIIVAIIQSKTERSAGQFRTWADENVLPRFQRIDGIADVLLRGGQQTEIQIDFDAGEVAARGLSLSRVAAVLRGELRDLSAGDITIGKRRFLVRTPVSPRTPVEFADVIVGTSAEGAPIRIGDVATVAEGLRKPAARVFSNGKESLALLFFRESGTNVLEVTENVRAAADQIQQDLMEPRGLTLDIVSDQTGYIYGALGLVQQNLLIGALLAVIVLLLFLRSVGASAVVSIAIPVCVVGTALGMSLLGRTVNVVSLAGMAFAVGLVVDNALVVIENIDTWRGRGEPAARAALLGTREVWGAILASTLTTAAVFIPIIGWQDEVGELLRDIAIAISIAVLVSLVVSVLVVPSFAARLTRDEGTRRVVLGGLAARGELLRQMVGRWVQPLAASGPKSLAVVIFAVVGAVALAWGFLPPMEYLPSGNRNLVFGILVPPPGYAVEEMEAIGRGIQKTMLAHTGVEKDGVPALGRSFYVGSPERAFMGATAEDPDRVGEVADFMRRVNGEIPGVFGIAIQASLFGRSLGGGRSIEIDISGRSLDDIIPLGGRVLGMVRQVLPDAQVRPIPSLDLGAPELQVSPRREQLARVGLNASDLGLMADALIDGAIIGDYARAGEPKLDVVLRQKGGGLTDAASLAAAPVATPAGYTMPLEVLAWVEERLGPTVIQRIERRRAVTIQVTPGDDIALEDAMAAIRNEIVAPLRAEGVVGEEMDIELSGAAGNLEIAQARFVEVLLLALLISFLLLAALFEDFVAPIAVLVTVPLAAAGGVLNLLAVDTILGRQPLDMMTALGFVILIGIVVNNAILVVDGAIARLREGMELSAAVAAAVERRVRPIFMSTLTSLAGLTPLVVFPGSGSELYRGVGAIVLGGLALSTVLTLFVVPALFSLLWRATRRA